VEQAASTKAAQILLALDAHAKRVEKFVREKLENGELTTRQDLNMQLDLNKYHMKHMSDFFMAIGDKGGPPRVAAQKSFTRLLELTSTLRDLKTVCLPIAIRLKDDSCVQDAILFEKLIGYKIGLPKETSERKLLIEAIEEAVTAMHSKRIIHMDLYLSNIMWKRHDDGSYKVRIIDFDAAHKEGEELTLNTIAAMRDSAVMLFEKLGNHATFEHDKLHLEVLKEHLDDEELQIRDGETENDSKKRLDRRCSWLIAEYLQKKFET
jgi:serine/threonine protein kinase